MPYIVAEPCIKCKYTDCVAVCPVDCFYEGKNSLVIHPDECIDCGACEPECPTKAIFDDSSVPEKWKPYIEINAVLSGAKEASDADTTGWPEHLVAAAEEDKLAAWPNINEQKEPMPGADEAAKIEDKTADFDPLGA
ncbi:MAG: ferredoxin family protein [Myxococcales bacterium]|nr:MAG: ferredoxin family protein [Myxococcales bacterium]